jgi:hypothetical protein
MGRAARERASPGSRRRQVKRGRHRDYLPGDVPVVDEAPAPFVPDVLDDEDGGVVLEDDDDGVLLLELLELGVPLVLELVSEGDVVPVALPETEPLALPLVLGVVDDVSVDEDELELGGVVVVLGVVAVDEEELAGVEPELPLPLLLQPVAATEASARTATRGIRRFMTSSPIKVYVR